MHEHAALKRKRSKAEEPLIVRTAHSHTNAILECLRPDRLTPAHESGVQRLLNLLGPLPQYAFNSGELMDGAGGQRGVHVFAGSVYLDGYGYYH